MNNMSNKSSKNFFIGKKFNYTKLILMCCFNNVKIRFFKNIKFEIQEFWGLSKAFMLCRVLAILHLIIMKINVNMIKKLQFLMIFAVLTVTFISCSKSQKESAGNINSSLDDATKYAVTKHGESVKIVFKGD